MGYFLDNTLPASPYPWQVQQWQQLMGRAHPARLPHALLLAGEEGLGKLNFAAVLVDHILCEEQGDLACGACKSCLLRKAGNHPDLKVIELEDKKKSIGVGQIRELGDFLARRAQIGGSRCVLINAAEDLTGAAANALLKGLEEPGENTFLILVTHRPGALLATIKSRCQMIKFCTPSAELAEAWLEPKVNISAKKLLFIADGAPVKALEAGEWEWLEQREAMAKQLLALRVGRGDPLKIAAKWQELPVSEVFSWLQHWLLDWVKMSQGLVSDNRDLDSIFSSIVKSIQRESLFEFDETLMSKRLLLAHEGNPNILLMLEALLVEWSQLP